MVMRAPRLAGPWFLVSLPLIALCFGLLAGCADDEAPPAPAVFPALQYSYLKKLRLNVGIVNVENHAVPQGPDDVSAQAPVLPADALVQMAHDRLFAAGLTGHADFVIDQASIIRGPGDVLTGTLAVHLDVWTEGGTRAGYAEARISRQHVPGSEPENQRVVLYDMTKQMMDAMNVEIEYQLHRSLSDWLVGADVLPGRVSATPLAPATEGPPEAPLPPPAAAPPSVEGPGPQMSPPPGNLTLPPSTQ
jgi:hypothetical protein